MTDLTGKTREELLPIAEKLKIKVHHKASAATIAKQIMQQPVAYRTDAMQHKAEAKVAPTIENTPDAVLDAIKAYTAKGLQAEFLEDGTWIFKCKGAEESGNMSIPLRVIKMKAETVSRGAYKPRTVRIDGENILSA